MRYVVIYDTYTVVENDNTVVKNQTHYARSMDDIVVWLQEHTEAMVVCIAEILH